MDNNLINESKSTLLDICSDKFTYDVVFSSDKKFELTESNAKKLFDVFDEYFFNRKLSTVANLSLFIGNPSDLNSVILNYTNGIAVDLNRYLALYQPDLQNIRRKNGIFDATLAKDAIFINTNSNKYATFAYFAQAMFHEMIHAFDMHFGTLFNYTLWALSTGATLDIIDYNSHLTKGFKTMKEKFEHDTNINLLSIGNNIDFNELCKKAAEHIHLLKENELSDIIKKVFTKETVEKYKENNMIQFSDDY